MTEALAGPRGPRRHAFVVDDRVESMVDLDCHRAASDLDDLARDQEQDREQEQGV